MFITDEQITGDGTTTLFELDNNFKPGTLYITYNDNVFYEFSEDSTVLVADQSVADNTERDAIAEIDRSENMIVYVTDTTTYYQLQGGITNGDWVEVTNGYHKVLFDFPPASTDVILVSYYTMNTPKMGNATRYASVRQVREKSNITSITDGTVTDASLEQYIRDTEAYIDSIVGYWESEYDTQRLIFPRLKDADKNDLTGVAEYAPIPENITRATILAVENMYTISQDSEAFDGFDFGDFTNSESLGDYRYSKEVRNSKSPYTFAQKMIGGRAMALLNGYVNKGGSISLDMRDVRDYANSREKFVNERK